MTTPDALHHISISINGQEHRLEIPARRTLADLLRYNLNLTGTKEACGVGVCGVCTVLLDGRMTASCITLAVQSDGANITTIEGIADNERLHPLQQSFIENGGLQCGICTPGQVMAAKSLLDANPSPTEQEIREWMAGNLCRCTGYYQILESIVQAVLSSSQRPT